MSTDTLKDEDWVDCNATSSDDAPKDDESTPICGNSAPAKKKDTEYEKRTPIATLIIEKPDAEATIEETYLCKPALFWKVEGLSQVAFASCKSLTDNFKLVFKPSAETTFARPTFGNAYHALKIGCFGWIGGGSDDIVQRVRQVIGDVELERMFTKLSKHLVQHDQEARSLLPHRTKDLLSGYECTDFADQKHVYKAHFWIKEPEFVTEEIKRHKHTDVYFNVVDRDVPFDDIEVTVKDLTLLCGRQRRMLYIKNVNNQKRNSLSLNTFGWFSDFAHMRPQSLDLFLVEYSGKEEVIFDAFDQLIIKLLETPHTKPKRSLPLLEYANAAGDSIVVHWYQSREPGKILDRVESKM